MKEFLYFSLFFYESAVSISLLCSFNAAEKAALFYFSFFAAHRRFSPGIRYSAQE